MASQDTNVSLRPSSLHIYIAGQIPLRQLVYRVLDLPPSMRPLVYDFGQLNTGTESDYIKQIVTDHVSSSRFIPCYNDHTITLYDGVFCR